jgi:hypothetical protein
LAATPVAGSIPIRPEIYKVPFTKTASLNGRFGRRTGKFTY